MNFATKRIQQYPPHLRYVATLPWEIKNSNFCRYSADMEENANKLHFSPLTLLLIHSANILKIGEDLTKLQRV